MPAKKTAKKIEPKVQVTTISKKFSGIVVSDKNDKTIIVKVETVKVHPKYKKRYVVSRRYKVHDEKMNTRSVIKLFLLNVARSAAISAGAHLTNNR